MAVRLTDDELRTFLAGPYAQIVGAVRLVTGSHAAAEDAVHEALARAWERRDRIDRLDRWVVTVALNLARSRWRRLRREVPAADDTGEGGGGRGGRRGPGPGRAAAVAAVDGTSVDLDRALRGLPRRQREVVVLHYLLDLRVADIAELLGLSDGAVKHSLFRARRSLAGALALEEDTTL